MKPVDPSKKAFVNRVFSDAAPTYDQIGPPVFAHFGECLVNAADLRPGSRVLDVASGRGAVLIPAAARVGPHGYVAGIDLSTEMVSATRSTLTQRGISNAAIQVMDAETLEFDDDSFDYVLCGFALFFFPDLPRALTEIRRVLRPGGPLIVSTWTARDERWNWYDDLLKVYVPDGSGLTTTQLNRPENVLTALGEAGFEHVHHRIEEREFFYRDPDEWWESQWTHGARAQLEQMPPQKLARFREELSSQLLDLQSPDGLPRIWRAIIAVGRNPLLGAY